MRPSFGRNSLARKGNQHINIGCPTSRSTRLGRAGDSQCRALSYHQAWDFSGFGRKTGLLEGAKTILGIDADPGSFSEGEGGWTSVICQSFCVIK